LAFFTVSGLVGAGVGLLGVRIYLIVRELELARASGLLGNRAETLAEGLVSILYECGVVFAAAAVVFLLAPRSAAPAHEQTSSAP
jgi:hypothetical protein